MNPNDPSLRISREDLSYIAHAQRTLASSSGVAAASSASSSSSRRPSTSSSNTVAASSAASISLDPRALQQLSAHFEALLAAITSRVDNLSQQTLGATTSQHRRASKIADHANSEMDRLREIIHQCDELQNEMLKIRRIGEIVKGFRARVEALEQRLGR